MIRSLVLAAGLAAAIGFAGTASASLIGTTIDVTSGSGFLQTGGCSGLTVGAGVECRIGDSAGLSTDVIDVNVQDSRVVFEFIDVEMGGADYLWSETPFVFDVVVSGLTWVDDPLAEIASISTTTELFGSPGGLGSPNTIGAVLSGPNQVTLNFGDLDRVNCGTSLCARLTVDITPGQKQDQMQVVPLPAGLPLLLGGIALLGAVSWPRARR